MDEPDSTEWTTENVPKFIQDNMDEQQEIIDKFEKKIAEYLIWGPRPTNDKLN